jgi:hypothetical protein
MDGLCTSFALSLPHAIRGVLAVPSAPDLTRLTDLRFLPPLALRIVEPCFGAAPDMFGDAVRAENPPARDGRRGLGVEPGEHIVTGVLAPDDDPGHHWLLSAPLVLVSPSQRETLGTGSIQKTLPHPGREHSSVKRLAKGWINRPVARATLRESKLRTSLPPAPGNV